MGSTICIPEGRSHAATVDIHPPRGEGGFCSGSTAGTHSRCRSAARGVSQRRNRHMNAAVRCQTNHTIVCWTTAAPHRKQ
eukprot:scaffold24540_cov22-Tisochrysis_lutea.AAC.1